MQAVRCRRAGGPEVLVCESVPLPVPGPGEARVRLKAASLNHLDVWLRKGTLPVTFPHIPGSDGAGVVDALGPRVGGVSEGEPCLIAPGLSCGRCEACAAGDTQLCPDFRIFGTTGPGTYAEYTVVPARNLVPLPEGLGFVSAAALPVAGQTAWHLLVARAQVRPGETVLVHGAGSGLGAFAIQIARLHGARVLTTAGSADKCSRALELGAEAAFDHTTGDFAGWVLEQTGGRGVDVVFDHVGAGVFNANLHALAVGGRLLVCGTTTGGDVAFNLRDLFGRQQTLHGARLGGNRELFQVVAHAAAGRIVPVIDTVFPLSEARAAHERMEQRRHFGKIILEMP